MQASSLRMHQYSPPPVNLTDVAIQSIRKDLAWTEAYVLLAFVLLTMVFIIGIVRRRHRYARLPSQILTWLPYSLLFFMIPYILGLILSDLFFEGKVLSFLWAVFLLFIYGSVDNFNAVDLDDRRQGKVFFFKDLLQVFILLLGFIVFYEKLKPYVVLPLVLVLVFAELKVVERTVGLMYSTCCTPSLRSCPLLNGSYDHDEDDHNEDDHRDLVVPVQECKYLVSMSTTKRGVVYTVTVEKIWHCEDGILLNSESHVDHHLKDCCLSFSLFWMLLRRFVGFQPYETKHQEEAWKLVRYGLLAHEREYERPFRVIEVELSFLYDFFYSKYFCFYQIGILWQLKHLLFLGVVGWIIALYFTHYDKRNDPFKIEIKEYDIDTLVTKIVITIITLVEITQFIIFITSRWAKVMVLCLYVTRESWNKKSVVDCLITKTARIICSIRLHESFSTWRNELSQYSLLESYSHLKCIRNKILNAISLMTGLFCPRVGRKESKAVKVSNEVKRAVIVSLQKHGRHLTNGIASLKASGLSEEVVEKLNWATKLETDIHVILVWHIATTLCEVDINEQTPSDFPPDFEVATSLSKYCAYLVAFAPELLSGYAAKTDDICSQAIKDANKWFKGYKKLKEIDGHVGDVYAVSEESIVRRGIKLGNELREIGDLRKRWEVLAAFWAEMILFMAPNSTNEIVHAEKLADGGEFITHLWVLLFHAGIVDRNSFTSETAQTDNSAASH